MRYLITGGSGYIGSRLVARLSEREDTESILVCDVRPPRAYRPKAEFRELDVRAATAVRTLDWTPRHTTRDAFQLTMRAKGKLGGEGLPSLPKPDLHAPVGA